MTQSKRNVIPAFAAMRFAVGAGAWLAPHRTARVFGMGPGPHQAFITQLFGSRDVALAVAITDTASPQLRTRALQLGVLADTLDTIASLRGVRTGELSRRGAVLGGGGAVVFAALGLFALSREADARLATTMPVAAEGSLAQSVRALVGGWTDSLRGRHPGG